MENSRFEVEDGYLSEMSVGLWGPIILPYDQIRHCRREKAETETDTPTYRQTRRHKAEETKEKGKIRQTPQRLKAWAWRLPG